MKDMTDMILKPLIGSVAILASCSLLNSFIKELSPHFTHPMMHAFLTYSTVWFNILIFICVYVLLVQHLNF